MEKLEEKNGEAGEEAEEKNLLGEKTEEIEGRSWRKKLEERIWTNSLAVVVEMSMMVHRICDEPEGNKQED